MTQSNNPPPMTPALWNTLMGLPAPASQILKIPAAPLPPPNTGQGYRPARAADTPPYDEATHRMVIAVLALEIADERVAQVTKHHFTFESDDRRTNGELAQSAGLIANIAGVASPARMSQDAFFTIMHNLATSVRLPSPMGVNIAHDQNYREHLIRAAAMLFAEIERLDRLAQIES